MRWFGFIILVFLLLGFVFSEPSMVVKAEVNDKSELSKHVKITPTLKDERNTQKDSLYSTIYNALLNVEYKVDVSKYTKNNDKVWATIKEILENQPEIFYFSYEGSLFWSNGILELNYKYPEREIVQTNKKIERIVDGIISENIREDMSDFEKVKAIHDYVVLNTAYDYDNYLNQTVPTSSYNIDGLLTKGIAVCDGYAKTMNYLLEKIGIDVVYLTGYVNNGSLHAWNKVKIGDEWYSLDATWNDPAPNIEGYVRYDYFLIPDDKMDDDHTWDDTELPDATDSTYLFMTDMRDFSINNEYYYYSSISDQITLYKIKLDGTDKTKIADIRVNELVVYEDWIYFSNYSYGGYLFKIKTDGTSLTRLNNFHVKNLEIKKGILKYTDQSGYYNYKLNLSR